jgi:hypothetical protein
MAVRARVQQARKRRCGDPTQDDLAHRRQKFVEDSLINT